MADLTLRIKRYWFDSIFIGEKKVEYREMSKFYKSRIEGKNITRLILLPGYSKDIPVLIVKVKKIVANKAKRQYEIHVSSRNQLYFDNVKEMREYERLLEEARQREQSLSKK